MSNPYRRPMRERVYKPLEFRSLTGEDVAEHYAELWQFALDDTGGVSESFSDIALRLRHGARAACKRLREERDEARGHYRWMVEHAADQKLDGYRELGARAAAAEDERDAARLELRALEWLALHGYPVGRDPDGGRVMAVYREDDLEPDWHPSWESAARALGWEG